MLGDCLLMVVAVVHLVGGINKFCVFDSDRGAQKGEGRRQEKWEKWKNGAKEKEWGKRTGLGEINIVSSVAEIVLLTVPGFRCCSVLGGRAASCGR